MSKVTLNIRMKKMFNVKKELPNGDKFTGKAIRYIFDVDTKNNYINNAQKKSYVDRVYRRND